MKPQDAKLLFDLENALNQIDVSEFTALEMYLLGKFNFMDSKWRRDIIGIVRDGGTRRMAGSKRELLALLKKGDSEGLKSPAATEDLGKRVDECLRQLRGIEKGSRTLCCRYTDHWLETQHGEVFEMSDPEDVCRDLRNACACLVRCVVDGFNDGGKELADAIRLLEIPYEGEDNENSDTVTVDEAFFYGVTGMNDREYAQVIAATFALYCRKVSKEMLFDELLHLVAPFCPGGRFRDGAFLERVFGLAGTALEDFSDLLFSWLDFLITRQDEIEDEFGCELSEEFDDQFVGFEEKFQNLLEVALGSMTYDMAQKLAQKHQADRSELVRFLASGGQSRKSGAATGRSGGRRRISSGR